MPHTQHDSGRESTLALASKVTITVQAPGSTGSASCPAHPSVHDLCGNYRYPHACHQRGDYLCRLCDAAF